MVLIVDMQTSNFCMTLASGLGVALPDEGEDGTPDSVEGMMRDFPANVLLSSLDGDRLGEGGVGFATGCMLFRDRLFLSVFLYSLSIMGMNQLASIFFRVVTAEIFMNPPDRIIDIGADMISWVFGIIGHFRGRVETSCFNKDTFPS